MCKAHVSANFTAGHDSEASQGDLGLAYLLPPGCRSSSLLRLRARRAAAVYKPALALLTCIATASLGLGSHALVKSSYMSDQFHQQASHSGGVLAIRASSQPTSREPMQGLLQTT